MATLQGQEIKDTYQALLKTDGNININGNLQVITDGQGNPTILSLSNKITQNQGDYSIGLTGWANNGGTSGSQYYLYNSSNRTIYLNAYYQPTLAENGGNFAVNTPLTSSFTPGKKVTFIHTLLGPLQGTVESSYFYDGEGDNLTLITLTTDPSNGVDDKWNSVYPNYPTVALNDFVPTKGGFNFSGFSYQDYIYDTAFNNNGGTSGSQYFVYNAENKSIYLDAYTTDWNTHITTPLTASFPPGREIIFIHSVLGVLEATISSSYFYNSEGSPLTIIQLTTDPSNGVSDIYQGQNNTITYTHAFTPHGSNMGVGCQILGLAGQASGLNNLVLGSFSHVEGDRTTAIGLASHAEGWFTKAIGIWSHAEGYATKAIEQASHAEGYYTKAIGQASHAEGNSTTAIGIASHAEGRDTTAIGWYSHAEGYNTKAIGESSHAEGQSLAQGNYSHAEGQSVAIGIASHAEGAYSTSIGIGSHVEGYLTTAIGNNCHAEGWGTVTSSSFNGSTGIIQHADGRWNVIDTSSLLIIGNGTADNARSNALSVTTFGTNNTTASAVLQQVSQSCNFANDTAAAAGGVPLGGLYHSSGTIKIRLV